MNPIVTKRCSPVEEAIYQDGFQAGAASRDVEIAEYKLERAIRQATEKSNARLIVERDQLRAELATQPDDSALEAIVKKAGEVMRERCASESCRSHEYDATKAIRTLPAVTLEDLK